MVTSTKPTKPAKRKSATSPKTPASQPSRLLNAAKQLQNWTGTLLGSATTAADLALSLAQAATKNPNKKPR